LSSLSSLIIGPLSLKNFATPAYPTVVNDK
jgi:hypothetical protein